MRCAVLILAAVLLPGCDYFLGAEPVRPAWPPLQPIRIWFETPDDIWCGEDYRVEVGRRGRYHLREKEVAGADLLAELFKVAETRRDLDRPHSPSAISLKLQCDENAPWRAVRRLIRAARHRLVRIRGFLFPVIESGSSFADDLYLWFPEDGSLPTLEEVRAAGGTVLLLDRAGPADFDPRALQAALESRLPEVVERPAVIVADGSVATGHVVRAFAAFFAAGIEGTLLLPEPVPGEDPDSPVGAPRARLDGMPVGDGR